MKIYFSVDLEFSFPYPHETTENLKKILKFIEGKGHTVYRAPYELYDKPYPVKTLQEKRQIHFDWLSDSEILLADIAVPSEGRSMILQRALDTEKRIILFRNKNLDRNFGSLHKALFEMPQVTYIEYDEVSDLLQQLEKNI